MTNRMILNETSYFGKGAIQHIPEEVTKRQLKKALIVTDKGLVKAGLLAKITDLLDANQLAYEVYDEIVPNPTVAVVKKGIEVYQASQADYLLALGGGSSMDTAKAIGIIINNPEFGDVVSLEGVAPTKNPSVPILAIPTTYFTENNNFELIGDEYCFYREDKIIPFNLYYKSYCWNDEDFDEDFGGFKRKVYKMSSMSERKVKSIDKIIYIKDESYNNLQLVDNDVKISILLEYLSNFPGKIYLNNVKRYFPLVISTARDFLEIPMYLK